MKVIQPVSPVLSNIELSNQIIIAKDQPQYKPLPAIYLNSDEILTRWKIPFWQRVWLVMAGSIYLDYLTFGRPIQPMKVLISPKLDWQRFTTRNVKSEIAKDFDESLENMKCS